MHARLSRDGRPRCGRRAPLWLTHLARVANAQTARSYHTGRHSGVITVEEFEAKNAQILERM
jgi:hypothetical protein